MITLPAPSGGDDSAALAAAINAAPAGEQIVAPANSSYKLSHEVGITASGVTIDLAGASFEQIGPRSGYMASDDAVFILSGANTTIGNCQITVSDPFAPPLPNLYAGKVRVYVSGCTVHDMTMTHAGEPSLGVITYLADGSTVKNVRVNGLGLAVLASNNATIDGCVVKGTAAGANGITVNPLPGPPIFPCNGITIKNTRVSGYGIWGIEITGLGGDLEPKHLGSPAIDNCRVGEPQAASTANHGGGAISCLGVHGSITNNWIIKTRGYGIEVYGGDMLVERNQLVPHGAVEPIPVNWRAKLLKPWTLPVFYSQWWKKILLLPRVQPPPPGPTEASWGIAVDAHDPAIGPTTVRENTIELMNIAVFGAHDPGSVVLQGNTIKDAMIFGINLGDATGAYSVTGNTLAFTRPGHPGDRLAIKWTGAANATVSGNTIEYKPGSTGTAGTTDTPIDPNSALAQNTVIP